MSKHIIFVCKSCNAKSEQSKASNIIDGTQLLNQFQNLHQNSTNKTNLEIREVGCLWTCSSPCAVAFSAPGKATYLFTNIPTTAAADLLTFGTLYHHSKDGNIPWKQFPEALQSAQVAKIPPV